MLYASDLRVIHIFVCNKLCTCINFLLKSNSQLFLTKIIFRKNYCKFFEVVHLWRPQKIGFWTVECIQDEGLGFKIASTYKSWFLKSSTLFLQKFTANAPACESTTGALYKSNGRHCQKTPFVPKTRKISLTIAIWVIWFCVTYRFTTADDRNVNKHAQTLPHTCFQILNELFFFSFCVSRFFFSSHFVVFGIENLTSTFSHLTQLMWIVCSLSSSFVILDTGCFWVINLHFND